MQCLNQAEYDALIQVKIKPNDPSRCRSKCFDFKDNYHLNNCYTQQLKAKQSTLIFKGRMPRHPGEKPESSNNLQNWQRQANRYANYVLTMFRPILDNEEQEYTWDALNEWINELQGDANAISKARLLAIDRRMNGLHSPFLEKVITTNYRFRSQDKWTDPEQTRRWNVEDYLDDIARGHDDTFCNEDEFSEQHKTFSPQKLKMLKKILHDDEQICESMIE